jgi:hypothetical protein
MENHWYGLWALELQRITEPFNNIIVVPQYALWFAMPEEEPEFEEVEEIDEDAISEVSDDDGMGGDEVNPEPDDSEDELDCFRDKDESTEPIKDNNLDTLGRRLEQDPDTSIAESLFTIPDGSAPQLTPDFVALHILAKELNMPTTALLVRRYERRAGYRITHECCPLVMEIKSFPKRGLKPARLSREVFARLADARQDLGFQCYHLFKKYEHTHRTLVVAASGDYWTHRIVDRTEVPRGVGDEMDTFTWDSLIFPAAVVLGTPASNLRIKEITDYLHTKPHQH